MSDRHPTDFVPFDAATMSAGMPDRPTATDVLDIGARDAEIVRLRALVESAFTEGWEAAGGAMAVRFVAPKWAASDAKKVLDTATATTPASSTRRAPAASQTASRKSQPTAASM